MVKIFTAIRQRIRCAVRLSPWLLFAVAIAPLNGPAAWGQAASPAAAPAQAVQISYRLPANGRLPRTYRVLNFDMRAAAIWGELTAKASGPLPLRDSLIGAIARSRGYHVVTRDVAPFERMGCKLLNPWQ